MRAILLAVGLSCLGSMVAADVNGVWRTERSKKGGYSDIQFYQCGGKTCGKLKTAFRKDGSVNTSFPGVGTTVIKGMSSKDGANYSGGTLTHTETGKTYFSKMKLSNGRLKISGCVAGGLLCQSVKLTRR